MNCTPIHTKLCVNMHITINRTSQNRCIYWALTITCHLISSQSLNFGGCRGTTDDIATIYLSTLPCLSLPSGNLQTSFPSIPWCYLPISSSVFLSFFLLSLSPAELSLPFPRILRWGHTILSFRFFTMVRRSSCTPIAFWILLRTSSFVTWSLQEMFRSLL